ncbi:MAG: 2-oxoglutarate dehydrogenase complex dihydrolipoyllysine-residue succinyltransferase [Anaerolineae bacterium]|nr:2-oxoglutarate dehydrogenase complex dihydrolipoyllysine-residue succinyltransferase [Anaerolineae bacterium]
MAFQIKVPDLGESVVEATVARWLKNEGDPVAVGEALVVLQTDKVDLEVGAEKSGVLSKIDHPAGTDVKIGDVLGSIDDNAAVAPNPAPEQTLAPATQEPVDAKPASTATPVAQRVAKQQDIDLAQVPPGRPGGRVTKSDVQRYLEAQHQPATQTPAPRPVVPTPFQPPMPVTANDGRAEERIKMSRRRRTIAARLVEAQHTAAMLTTFNEIDMSAVQELRERRKNAFKERYGVSLGLSSFFVKAVIGALKFQPRINAEIQTDEIVLKKYYDIGVAIGAPEGLVVPVLRDADRMSFAEIEKAIKDYAKQSEQGTLSLEALRGGTFTITNGGVFGSMMSTPILNPPQVGILGLHKIEPRPVVVDNQIVIRPMMYVALSYDHRIVDGREAVQFLVRVKELIEDPESLLIEG